MFLHFIILLSSFLVISVYNPIHSLLFLILTFFNTSLYLIFQGLDFLGIFILIVYVGALSILFLFVLMLLNISSLLRSSSSYSSLLHTFPILFFCTILGFFLVISAFPSTPFNSSPTSIYISSPEYLDNMTLLGSALFTSFALPFILSSFVLFVALFGVISVFSSEASLTSPSSPTYYHQSVYTQNSSTLSNHLFL